MKPHREACFAARDFDGWLQTFGRPERWAWINAMVKGELGVTYDELRHVLQEWWTDAEMSFSGAPIATRRMLKVLKRVGYITDGPPNPTRTLVVYRGGNASGPSWTTTPRIARWFAQRYAGGVDAGVLVGIETGRVYRGLAAPEHVSSVDSMATKSVKW